MNEGAGGGTGEPGDFGEAWVADLLRGDHHVHSTFSDDATSTLAENLAGAAAAGLQRVRLTEHVRADTTWLPEFVAAVAAEPVPASAPGLLVLTGVEAKIMDATGRLDLPPGPLGVDATVIADHRFPGPDGPWSPEELRRRLAAPSTAPDALTPAAALDLLVGALIGAMESTERGQLAHCFSILPKAGLSEDDLGDDHLRAWATTAARTGTLIEVNEKWACPGPRALRAALGAGAELVASTDAHAAADSGVYRRVPDLLREAAA